MRIVAPLTPLWLLLSRVHCLRQSWAPLNINAAGLNLLYLGVLSFVYCGTAILIDYAVANPWLRKHLMSGSVWFDKRTASATSADADADDADVAAEKQRVLSGGAKDEVLVIKVMPEDRTTHRIRQ